MEISLSTALEADCWMKRVISFAPIEKLFQLIIAPGVLMIDSRLPCWVMVALPATTVGLTGLASAPFAAKQEATASAIALGKTVDGRRRRQRSPHTLTGERVNR